MFGQKTKMHSRTELIMFMTPHVIFDETNLIEASDELKARVKMLRRYIRGDVRQTVYRRVLFHPVPMLQFPIRPQIYSIR